MTLETCWKSSELLTMVLEFEKDLFQSYMISTMKLAREYVSAVICHDSCMICPDGTFSTMMDLINF